MKKLLLVILQLIIGCSYSVYSSGAQDFKSISISVFKNNTTEYYLEEDISNYLTDQFEDDGRLKIVELSPDCRLDGDILDYSENIYSYDQGNVDEYEIKILFKIIFTDLTRNKVAWQNESLLLSEKYSNSNEYSEFRTKEEAQEEIFKDLFELIIKESLEEW